MTKPSDTPDSSLIREQNAALREENKALKEEVEQLKQHNYTLRLKVDAMARKLFGKSSEKLDADQLQLVFDALRDEPPQEAKKPDASDLAESDSEAEEAAATAPPAQRKKKRKLADIIDGLPTTETIIDPPEVLAQPEAWECIGAEVTKLIDIEPAKFKCNKIIRRKYVRKDARHLPPITPPLNILQERCIAAPGLLAHTLINRFELHLPFYRIEQMYARLGVPISRQTMCGWAGMAHDASRLIVEAIQREVFADGYVQIDETPVKYQDPEREGVCGTGYLWVIYNPVRNVSLFVWRTGRGAVHLDDIVPEDFRGIIQCDGYAAYDSLLKLPHRQGRITLIGCMAHARRKFFEAKAEGATAQWVLAQIQKLYRIEAQLRDLAATPEQTLEDRQHDSAPIMERIKARLIELKANHKHRPTSLTGAAISYALNQWDKLSGYLRDGRVQIDNNLVENTIRPSAIGKKNWLFMGDAQTGARAATFYTLISNAQREGVDATTYLTDIFKRLPTETTHTVHRLTPNAWAAEQAALRQALAQSAVVGA
jgi:transposase